MNASDSLDDLLPSIWSLLERGASDRREPFHCPVLATAGAGEFGARTVILRKVHRDERALLAHSDRRATKIGQILASPRVVWVFYDARKKVQVRAESDVEAVEQQRRSEAPRQYQHAEASAMGGEQEEPTSAGEEIHTPYTRQGRKIGRNEPCPCGSGKKYKQCHGRLS